MYRLGYRVYLDRDKLKYYIDSIGWSRDIYNSKRVGFKITSRVFSSVVGKEIKCCCVNFICDRIVEPYQTYYVPVDCLITREMKLKKILK